MNIRETKSWVRRTYWNSPQVLSIIDAHDALEKVCREFVEDVNENQCCFGNRAHDWSVRIKAVLDPQPNHEPITEREAIKELANYVQQNCANVTGSAEILGNLIKRLEAKEANDDR